MFCVLQILEGTVQVFSHRRQGNLCRMMTCKLRHAVMKISSDKEGICHRACKCAKEVPSFYIDECIVVQYYLFGSLSLYRDSFHSGVPFLAVFRQERFLQNGCWLSRVSTVLEKKVFTLQVGFHSHALSPLPENKSCVKFVPSNSLFCKKILGLRLLLTCFFRDGVFLTRSIGTLYIVICVKRKNACKSVIVKCITYICWNKLYQYLIKVC